MSSYQRYLLGGVTNLDQKTRYPQRQRETRTVRKLEPRYQLSMLLGTTKVTQDAFCCRFEGSGRPSGCTHRGRDVVELCRRRGKHCNCQHVAIRVGGVKCTVGRGAMLGLVGVYKVGDRIELHGCYSCGKRVKQVTPGLLRHSFTTRGPGRG